MFTVTYKSLANVVTAPFSYLFSEHRKCNKSERSFIFEGPKSSDLTSTIHHGLGDSISWLNVVLWSSSCKTYKEQKEKEEKQEPLWEYEVRESPSGIISITHPEMT